MSTMQPTRWKLEPAREAPKFRDRGRLMVIDENQRTFRDRALSDLPYFLRTGDLLVLNDAATLPASLRARADGQEIELRLLAQVSGTRWQVVLLGAGDWRIPTEHRPPPPLLSVGQELDVAGSRAYVVQVLPASPRLVEVEFDQTPDALLQMLYTHGQPVQYSHQRHPLALWSVQTSYASRPWAVEMPSAGRPLSFRVLKTLRARGVGLATLTHAAGLSATGDPALDLMLPLPERYDLPARTVSLIAQTRAQLGRVIAVGTSVARALEGCMSNHGHLTVGPGTTDLRLGPSTRRRVVDGLLSGVHVPGESHFDLFRAFASEGLLHRALDHAARAGYLGHELGDSTLLLSPRAALSE